MKLAAVAAALASSGILIAPTFASTQFDVECNGIYVLNGGKHEIYTIRYSIDLGSRRSCVTRTCTIISPIFAVTPTEIVLTNHRNVRDSQALDFRVAHDVSRIDRLTGRYTASVKITAPEREELKINATCSPKAFTPFPVAKP